MSINQISRIALLLFLAAQIASSRQAVVAGRSHDGSAHYRFHDGVALNDPTFTPGAVRTTDPNDPVIAGRESTRNYRLTTAEMKAAVYRLYGVNKNVVDRARFCTGIVKCDSDEEIAAANKGRETPLPLYEVDHLCPLELGCADTVRDLWVQPYFAHPGAHEKDDLENKLTALARAHKLTPEEAQREIKADWYSAYLKFVSLGK